MGVAKRDFRNALMIFSLAGKVKSVLRQWCRFATNMKRKPEFVGIRVYPYHFRRKYFTDEVDFTLCEEDFTDLLSESISLCIGHIPMPNTLKGVLFAGVCKQDPK